MEVNRLSVYKTMYYSLFNQVSDAIEAIRDGNSAVAEEILTLAQQEAEETYLSADGED